MGDFFQTPGACRASAGHLFHAERFFSRRRELKNVQLWIKRYAHHGHFLVSEPIRVEEGRDYRLYHSRTTMEKLILLVSEYLFSSLDQIAGLP